MSSAFKISRHTPGGRRMDKAQTCIAYYYEGRAGSIVVQLQVDTGMPQSAIHHQVLSKSEGILKGR
jgi:hypothetical protein